jgi:DNA-binding transcriptional MerR regulator
VAEESENQMTVEQLAYETGLSVRNIRSHQARGLLPSPEVRSRVGYYGPEHTKRLKLIRELQAEGLKLEGNARLIRESEGRGEGLLRVREAADAAVEAESPEVVTVDDLIQRFGLAPGQGQKALEKAVKLRLLVPIGDDLFEAPSPSLLRAAEEAVGMGIELPRLLDAAEELQRHTKAVSRRFVKLFIEAVWEPFVEAGTPDDEWPAIAESMSRARPLAAEALMAVFRQSMSREIEGTLADIAKRLSQGKR